MSWGGGLFWPPKSSAAMKGATVHGLGIVSATLAALRRTGMVTSSALALAVAVGSLPREGMMQLLVGTNVTLGSRVM